MKKKLVAILTLCIMLCTSMFTLVGCGNVKFDVKFMVDGEVYATVSTKGSGLIQMPKNPEKEDYTFEGWFWDEGIWQEPFTANSLLNVPLSSDMAVYAKFTKGQITGVTFEDVETTYDGTQKLIAVSGLPEGATVTYDKPNAYTNAGEYVVTATVKLADHEDLQLTAKLTIKKAVYDMSGVSFNGKTVTYDGQAQSIEIVGNLPDGVSVSYDGNGKTEVGEYTVTAKFVGDSMNYELIPNMTAKLVVLDRAFDGLRFEDKTVTYNGSAHTIEVVGVPSGATVSYDKNTYTNAGEYTVTATISKANYKDVTLTATLVINKANYDMSGVTFEDKTVTYNGKTHSLAISGTLPNGVTVSYENNGKTNAGAYSVIAKFAGDSANYNAISNMSATLVISKANYDMSGITFADKEVTYNRTTHSLAISGTLPDGVTVSYENNGQVDADIYEVVAKFVGDSANYNAISNMYATLTINKATYDMSNVVFNDKTVDYNGQSHSITALRVPVGVIVEYEGNGRTESGKYTITAYFTGDENNYEYIEEMTATLWIRKNSQALYEKYQVLGKSMDLTSATSFDLAVGAKSIFSNELYYEDVVRVDEGEWAAETFSSSDYEEVVNNFSEKASIKTSRSVSFLSLFSIGFDFSIDESYEKKVKESTNTYFYTFRQNVAGYTASINGFNDMTHFASLLSEDFIAAAEKVKNGTMSAQEFIAIWGTHVIMAANYGAGVEATYSEVSHNKIDSSNYALEISAGINASIEVDDIGASAKDEAKAKLENYQEKTSNDKFSKVSIKGYGGQALGGTSFESFNNNYSAWASSLKEENYVWYDVPDGSLMCVWDFLGDEYDGVKRTLDKYFEQECSEDYTDMIRKINGIYKDDVVYDNLTKTLTLNLKNYQETGDATGFVSDNFVDGVYMVNPYYRSNPVEKIVINGLYMTKNAEGYAIETKIKDFALAFGDSWTKDIVIELNNVGIIAPSGKPCIDLSKVTTNVEIIVNSIADGFGNIFDKNYLQGSNDEDDGAKEAIIANNLTISGSGTLTIFGGSGADGATAGANGSDGSAGIIANNLTISGAGVLTVVGGSGGKGANGVNGNNGSGNDAPGSDGGKGGDGGNGASAIICTSITVSESFSVTLKGGAGGNGGAGGRGGDGADDNEAFWGSALNGKGGNGGNGGKGGVCAKVIETSNSFIPSSVNCIEGTVSSGGCGGDGGNGGNTYNTWFNNIEGSDGGSGGQGGLNGDGITRAANGNNGKKGV